MICLPKFTSQGIYVSVEAAKRNTYFLSNVASRNPKVTKVS